MGTDSIIQPGIIPPVGSSIYFIGIKGTGTCALAELMLGCGFLVSGSDTCEKFYTDDILKELNIPYYEGFDAERINAGIDLIIHSAAYSAETNPELARAAELEIPVLKYTEALGAWSARFDSTGVCGVHGKTTTTAFCGVCARAARLPAQILTGSAAADFGGRSTLSLGSRYFIAETCEYREHFLSFRPRRIILTSVESDHQDYFPDYESIRDAFVEYCRLLPAEGQLIYCADDPGASEIAAIIEKEHSQPAEVSQFTEASQPEEASQFPAVCGIELIPYGFTAEGDFKITSYNVENEKAVFSLAGFPGVFKLRIPGRHEALNAAAAIALTVSLAKEEFGAVQGHLLSEEKIQSIKNDLENFRSTKRRSEIIGEVRIQGQDGIIFMDDYGHHPTAIKTTLAGIKSFYPARRLIVSFMSHTYTRTSALLEEFASAFDDADILFLHKIYSSARENYDGSVDGKTLYEKAAKRRRKAGQSGETYYAEEPDDAFSQLCDLLKGGDIFITLGAGNNWTLGEKLFAHFKSANEQEAVND